MERKNWVIVGLVGVGSVVVSALLVNMLLGNPDDKSMQFSTIEAISPTVADPDPEVFNAEAINPTVEVYIGDLSESF